MVQGRLNKFQGGLSPPWHPTSRAYVSVNSLFDTIESGLYGLVLQTIHEVLILVLSFSAAVQG